MTAHVKSEAAAVVYASGNGSGFTRDAARLHERARRAQAFGSMRLHDLAGTTLHPAAKLSDVALFDLIPSQSS